MLRPKMRTYPGADRRGLCRFRGESAVPLIADHPNLLIVQTMSKSRALAGLRVGYALGGVGLIEALHRVKNSQRSNEGQLSQSLATPARSANSRLIPSAAAECGEARV